MALVSLFAAGAVAVTWPLATSLGDGLPLGTERIGARHLEP